MYSERDLDGIVKHFRKVVEPTEINKVSDVKSHPNDVLMNYFVADEGLNRNQLAELLEDYKELETWLGLYVPNSSMYGKLASLDDSADYSLPETVSASIQSRTGKFSFSYGDMFMVADQKREAHEYPSGEEIEYFSLANERSANISIFDGGYEIPSSNTIYVRENFVTMMLAVMDTQRDDDIFLSYRNIMGEFEHNIRGITIAHEKSHMDLVRRGMDPDLGLELELESERGAIEFLEQQGVDNKHYELYHLLRASPDGYNVSQAVVDQNFTPASSNNF